MKRMSEEDRRLWSTVARSVTPAPGRTSPLVPEIGERHRAKPPKPEPKRSQATYPAPTPPASPRTMRNAPAALRMAKPAPPLSDIDRRSARRIAKGHTAIDARLDLHGMTQEVARARLLDFLGLSRAMGHRTVLVITGKGTVGGSLSGGRGVLHRAVPEWLRLPPFDVHVSAVSRADRRHGGDGALYVRLKRSG